ncbi:unnamed protein product [Brassica napus]|uniref:(rape) hypothetical protein n=1 Tax=Brassica napus TaxID=3708 RepID=A0A816HYY1_BRANA|nr:unnamed protein product [Brassica napus]
MTTSFSFVQHQQTMAMFDTLWLITNIHKKALRDLTCHSLIRPLVNDSLSFVVVLCVNEINVFFLLRSVRCKLESSAPIKPPELMRFHAVCFHELKTGVVLLGDTEINLVAMPSKEKKFPCSWCFSVPLGLYDSSLRMLNTRCLSIVFDIDETLIVAHTMKSFEDRNEALKGLDLPGG